MTCAEEGTHDANGPISRRTSGRIYSSENAAGYLTLMTCASSGSTAASRPTASFRKRRSSSGASVSAMNPAARRLISLLNRSCFDLEPNFCRGSLPPSPNPMSLQSRTRSMSSEKRWITPCTFESDVPPLKTSDSLNGDFTKSSLRTRQTQKSFSTIAALMPILKAASEKTSRRSSAGSRASLSIHVFFSCDLLDRCIHPTGRRLCVEQHPLPQSGGEFLADRRDDFRRNAVFTICLQSLHQETAFGQFESRFLQDRVLEGQGRLP